MDAIKRRDVDSYNLFAQRWDHYSDKLSGPYVPRLMDMARIGPGMHALEVCCGTGVVSRGAARLVAPGGRALGVDITPGMIEVAAEAAARAGLNNLAFQVMDVEALDLPDAAFDAAVAMYPHFQDPDRALSELRRVLRPGGRLAIGVGGGLAPAGTVRPTPLAVQLMLDLLARHRQTDDGPAEGPAWAGADPRIGLPAALERAGFLDVTTATQTEMTFLETPEIVWEVWSMTSTPVRHRLASLAPAARDDVRREFLEAFRPLATDQTLRRPTGAVFAAGRSPD